MCKQNNKSKDAPQSGTLKGTSKSASPNKMTNSTPKGKYVFGTVKVGEKGQIVIPKEARDVFHIKPGDMLLVLGDEQQGIGIVKSELLREFAEQVMNAREIKED